MVFSRILLHNHKAVTCNSFLHFNPKRKIYSKGETIIVVIYVILVIVPVAFTCYWMDGVSSYTRSLVK